MFHTPLLWHPNFIFIVRATGGGGSLPKYIFNIDIVSSSFLEQRRYHPVGKKNFCHTSIQTIL